MKFKMPPLKINCEGLSKKLIYELADRLSLYFLLIEIRGEEINADAPLSSAYYDKAWKVLDKFGVKVI